MALTPTSPSRSPRTTTPTSKAVWTGRPSIGARLRFLGIAFGLAAPAPLVAQSREAEVLDEDRLFALQYLKLEEPIALAPDDGAIAITIEDRRLKVTPSGRRANAAGTWTYLEGCSISVVDTHTHAAKQVSPGANSWGSSWSPDGRRLAFFSDRGGSVALWLWDRHTGGTTRLLAVTPALLTRPEWTADGTRLLVTASMPAAQESSKKASLVEVFTSHAGPAAAGSSMDTASISLGPMSQIWLVNARTGRRRVIVRGYVAGAALSPNGRHVAYSIVRNRYRPGGPAYAAYGDIVVMRTDTAIVTSILHDVRVFFFSELAWSPTSQRLVYPVDHGLAFMTADDSTATVRTTLPAAEEASPSTALAWAPDGSGVYVASGGTVLFAAAQTPAIRTVATLDADVLTFLRRGRTIAKLGPDSTSIAVLAREDSSHHSSFRVIDLGSGDVSVRLAAERTYGLGSSEGAQATTAVMRGGAAVFAAESATEPADVWLTDATLAHAEPLTRLNPGLASVKLGERRVFGWRAADGRAASGLLLLPAGYRQGIRYPLVVWVYQRSLRDMNEFGLAWSQFYNLQQFASRGYAVLYPDVEWRRDSVLSGLGGQVLPGIDSLIAAGIVDSARVGLAGHSSGGYDVLALLVQSRRFAAAVESSGWGAADMFSMYTTELDGTVGYDWVEKQMGLGRPPWDAAERYIRNSPGYFLNRVTAPLLILQGPLDDELGDKQSKQVFSGLRRLGKEVELRRYPGEGHAPEWWTPAAKRDAHRRMVEWLDSRLQPAAGREDRVGGRRWSGGASMGNAGGP